MAKITFEEIMAFYPEGNQFAYDELKRGYISGCLLPFVGAGLSAHFGYKGWPGILSDLVAFVPGKKNQVPINSAIRNNELLDAAQLIYDWISTLMIKRLRAIVNMDRYHSCKQSKLPNSAAFLLPKLFPNDLVITTNFDQVLEEVYLDGELRFECTVSPYDTDLLTQAVQGGSHCLLKLHGDIGRSTCTVDKLVFTRDQYDKAYAPGSLLEQALTYCFRSKKLLFLGSSLEKDKTMEVLQAVASKCGALDHYAILSCTKKNLPEKVKEMGDLGITAIYYPDGKYEAVRVILEHLLGEVKPDVYKNLPRCEEPVTDISSGARLNYNSGCVGFFGRTEEMEQLEAFFNCNQRVSWWAVTAPGGSGKSRLVYEFTRKKEKEGWKIRWLAKADYTSQSVLDLPGERCILVADDVQAYFDNLRQQLNQILANPRVNDLRVILLERDGKDLQSASWGNKIMETPYDTFLSDYCYNDEFLQLKPLSDEDLMSAMVSYTKPFGKTMPEDTAKELLAVLKRVDEELHRPLYAIAIVDAWCQGEKPEHWDRKQVLNALMERELRFYTGRLSSAFSGLHRLPSKREYQELESLLAMSYITEPLFLESVDEKDCAKLNTAASTLGMDLADLLEDIGVVREGTEVKPTVNRDGTINIETIRQVKVVMLDCPDLVKEYLVVQKSFVENGWNNLLLPEGWLEDIRRMRCIRRLLIDYPDALEQETRFLDTFFAAEPESDGSAFQYSDLLFVITAVLPKFAQCAVDRLEVLHEAFEGNAEIALQYANGLVNLSVKQDLAGREDSVRKLKVLHEAFEGNAEIALQYARVLFNLTVDQGLAGREDSVRKLKDLHEAFESNAEIALAYAKGLYNLTVVQDLAGREDSVRKLKDLHEAFECNADIALQYAMGLVNLSAKQDLTGCEDSVRKLKDLHEAFESNAKIALEYAKGLYNLTVDQDLAGREDSVRKLKDLHEAFESNAEIALAYANGLVNLSAKQDLAGREDSVRKLKVLHEAFESNATFAESYTCGLVQLSYEQWQASCPEAEVEQTLSQARAVENRFPGNPEIQLDYAKTWFNLTLVQTGEARTTTIQSLRKYLETHREANQHFQAQLDTYLSKHPDQTHLYAPLRL